VIPAAFDYHRASSVDEAVALLGQHGDDAKLLAGGHSLLPLMRLRLAVPGVLVDIGGVEGLAGIDVADGWLRIGALARHHDVAGSAVVAEAAPLLGAVAGQIGDPQVRHRGTLGGSIAHGDPASDLPAALLALRGTVVARGPGGDREIAADDLFTGFLETALAPDEVLTEVRVPVTGDRGWSFQKFNRRAQDWAVVAVAAVLADGDGTRPGVGLVNMGWTPLRAGGVEDALAGGASSDDAAAQAGAATEPPDDLNASPDYRRHLARVLTRRALAAAAA
jgi:aerobic carbon-monoxide dehydrogenase medium subunit